MRRPLFSFIVLLAGCAPAAISDAPKSFDEEDAPVDGAADSFRSPTEHGDLVLGVATSAEISRAEAFHAWTFTLSGDARVSLRTGAGAGGRSVDTVMYLYREGARGWGSYIARNDDSNGTLFSTLESPLGEGRYRVLVKGYDRRVAGAFELASRCDGAGCPGAPVTACLFGSSFRELTESTAFEGTLSTRIDASVRVTAERAAQIVRAVQISDSSVTDLSAALAAVDAGEVNLLELVYRASGETFTVVEFGRGDNSYGAVLRGMTTEVVAAIVDGDLADCTFTTPADGSREGEDCHSGECATGLVCEGMEPVGGIGRCVPEGRVEGEGDSCTASTPCPSTRLVCAGLSRDPSFGLCVPRWMQGTFSAAGPWSIPDNAAAGVTSEVTAYGLATVDMDVLVSGLVNHPYPADLLVTLTNPGGTTFTVWDGLAEEADAGYVELDQIVVRTSGDEGVNGTWTLRVVDRAARDVGTLERWSLTIISRWD